MLDFKTPKQINMPKKLFRKWLRALRSGLYDKAICQLANAEGTAFCCLGVLAAEQGCTWDADGTGHLVPRAKGAACNNKNAGLLRSTLCAGLPDRLQKDLANYNDERGGAANSHVDIADWLERNVRPAA